MKTIIRSNPADFGKDDRFNDIFVKISWTGSNYYHFHFVPANFLNQQIRNQSN